MLNPGIPGSRFAPETLHKLIIFQSFDIDEKHQNSAFLKVIQTILEAFRNKRLIIFKEQNVDICFLKTLDIFLFVISIEKRFFT